MALRRALPPGTAEQRACTPSTPNASTAGARSRYPHPDLEPALGRRTASWSTRSRSCRPRWSMAGLLDGRGRHAAQGHGRRRSARRWRAEREQFVEGVVAQGHPERLAVELFDMIEPFADYGFNASHACAYGYVAYQTAYLMAHHRVEYMAAILTSVKDDKDRKPYYLYACRGMGIEVLPPDVNESDMDFAPAPGDRRAIRYGLSAVRNVGEGVVPGILDARDGRRTVRVLRGLLPPGRAGVAHEARARVADLRRRVRVPRVHPWRARAAGRGAGRLGEGRGADPRRAQGRGRRSVLAVRRRARAVCRRSTRPSLEGPSSTSGCCCRRRRRCSGSS